MSALSTVFASRRFQWLLLLAFLFCYPLSLVMEPTWAWETGVVEIAQIAALSTGLVLACSAWLRMRPGRAAMLACCVLPVWMILIGRELSWGAVFMPPIDIGAARPVYSSRTLWYRPMVAPIAGLLLVAAGYIAWRHRLDRLLRGIAAAGRFPWGLLALMFVVALVSSLAEGHLGVPAYVFPHAESFEELVELVGYVALVAIQERVFHASRDIGDAGMTARGPAPARS